MSSNFKKHHEWAQHLSIVMQFGLTIAGCIIFCFLIGRYLDQWLGTNGVFITIFIILGVIGGANVAYRQILEVLEEDKKGKDSSNNDSG
ncbi:MAG: AtpZ/AtpI family protein [Desulfobacteraceae bacterium]|nr:AtpZ/AtpI family protein [Desulfobacteraceae bacterium]